MEKELKKKSKKVKTPKAKKEKKPKSVKTPKAKKEKKPKSVKTPKAKKEKKPKAVKTPKFQENLQWKIENNPNAKKDNLKISKKTSEEKKELKLKRKELRYVKRRLNEQMHEKKIQQKIQKEIEQKKVANESVLKYSIIKEGIKNKYQEASTNLSIAKENYSKERNSNNQIKLKKAKKDYKNEKKLIASEVKQINKLNKIAKGYSKEELDKDLSIKVENVRKIYAQKGLIFEALKDVNLEFKKGTFNVILGKSGSGKTTLLNMISGLDRATSGVVNINGTNIEALSTSQITQFRRHNIGFVFQSYNLLPSLNITDNIEVGRSLQTEKKLRRDIDELLEQMEMQHNKKKMTYELSGGQQQRVSIARALAKTPNILIGDEPTGALDHETTKKVFSLFQEINKKYKTTIIIVTHNPDVAKLGHQVIHVKDGRIEKVHKNSSPMKSEDVFK